MKNKILLLLIISACFLQQANAQSATFNWVKGVGGTGLDYARKVIADADGNVYVTGTFTNTVDFNPSASGGELTTFGNTDVFLCKFDSSGNFVWVRQMGSDKAESANAIELDGAGNVYVAGSFRDTADFNPGGGGGVLQTSPTLSDGFFARFDVSGNFSWVKQIGSAVRNDNCLGIHSGYGGNLYITGGFQGTVDFNASGSGGAITSSGAYDVYVCVFNSGGVFQWVKSMGGVVNDDQGINIFTDGSGNIFTIGTFRGFGDFKPGADTANLWSAFNGVDYEQNTFISKLDASGNYVWAKRQKGRGAHAVMDASGNIYVAGMFESTRDLDPADGGWHVFTSKAYYDNYISKLDPSGNIVWAKHLAGAGDDQINGIAKDAYGNIYITGYFSDTVYLTMGAAHTFVPKGEQDAFVAMYNTHGNLGWAKQIGGSDSEIGDHVTIDRFGNVYASGSFEGTTDFNMGGAPQNLTANGTSRDGYILKLAQQGVTGIETAMEANKIIVYPNPAQNYVMIEGLAEGSLISMADAVGREVYSTPAEQSIERIKTGTLTSGVYFIRISDALATITKRLVLNK